MIRKYNNHTLQTNPRHLVMRKSHKTQDTRKMNQSKVWRCSGGKIWMKVLKFEVPLIRYA